jgi:predicted amidohydrolase
LRARAIENACWVVAAAQYGAHEDGRKTYGHSLVVDPWGKIVLDMKEQSGLAFAEIDLGLVDDVRGRVPVITHRRAIPAVENVR